MSVFLFFPSLFTTTPPPPNTHHHHHPFVEPGDDSSDDESNFSKEELAVKAKVAGHHIKKLSTFLKVKALASVDGVLKRMLKSSLFRNGAVAVDEYYVNIRPVVLHSGIWRWMPDFALKPVPAETGRVHLGCQIGPYLVDWTDSSLVSIRTLASCEPLVLLRMTDCVLYQGPDLAKVEKLLSAAAQVIVAWNTGKKFDAKKGSAQNFVTELFAALGAKLSIPRAIGDVLDATQKHHEKLPDLVFSAPWCILPGDKKAKKHKFKSHAELDEWVLARRKEHPNLEVEHADDWDLLVLLDRLCWCGGAGMEREQMQEKDRPREEGCPFGPPAFHKVMEMDLGGGPKKSQLIKKKSIQDK